MQASRSVLFCATALCLVSVTAGGDEPEVWSAADEARYVTGQVRLAVDVLNRINRRSGGSSGEIERRYRLEGEVTPVDVPSLARALPGFRLFLGRISDASSPRDPLWTLFILDVARREVIATRIDHGFDRLAEEDPDLPVRAVWLPNVIPQDLPGFLARGGLDDPERTGAVFADLLRFAHEEVNRLPVQGYLDGVAVHELAAALRDRAALESIAERCIAAIGFSSYATLPAVQYEVTAALGRRGTPEAVGILLRTFEEHRVARSPDGLACLRGLGASGDESVVPRLFEWLADPGTDGEYLDPLLAALVGLGVPGDEVAAAYVAAAREAAPPWEGYSVAAEEAALRRLGLSYVPPAGESDLALVAGEPPFRRMTLAPVQGDSGPAARAANARLLAFLDLEVRRLSGGIEGIRSVGISNDFLGFIGTIYFQIVYVEGLDQATRVGIQETIEGRLRQLPYVAHVERNAIMRMREEGSERPPHAPPQRPGISPDRPPWERRPGEEPPAGAEAPEPELDFVVGSIGVLLHEGGTIEARACDLVARNAGTGEAREVEVRLYRGAPGTEERRFLGGIAFPLPPGAERPVTFLLGADAVPRGETLHAVLLRDGVEVEGTSVSLAVE